MFVIWVRSKKNGMNKKFAIISQIGVESKASLSQVWCRSVGDLQILILNKQSRREGGLIVRCFIILLSFPLIIPSTTHLSLFSNAAFYSTHPTTISMCIIMLETKYNYIFPCFNTIFRDKYFDDNKINISKEDIINLFMQIDYKSNWRNICQVLCKKLNKL